jgi:putative FmdB family regulatory protein
MAFCGETYPFAMPLFEYKCVSCGEPRFELLIRGDALPSCPRCGSRSVERIVSLFAVSSADTRKASLRTAKQKARRNARDEAIATAEEVRNHHH